MAYTYEAVVTAADLDLFEKAFVGYMDGLNFGHTTVGGRLGGRVSHEFQRGDQVITLTVSSVDQSTFRIAVDSETVSVEPVILDVLTEGVADFLDPFWHALPAGPSHQTLESVIKRLRDAFAEVLEEEEEI